jgi:hypothetical protein
LPDQSRAAPSFKPLTAAETGAVLGSELPARLTGVRAIEDRRTVIAVMLFAMLLIGDAALFMHAAIPDFLINYYAVP